MRYLLSKATRYRALGALVIAAVVLAGCGSSSSSTATSKSSSSTASSSVSSTASSASAGINVAAAKQGLATIVSNNDSMNLTKIAGSIPKNQTIDFVNCPLAICTEVGVGVQQATQALGWHFHNFAMNLTPSGYQQTWQEIAQSPGNGVVNETILPDSAIETQINKADVPVAAITDISAPAGHVLSVIASPRNVYREGTAEADWVIQNAGTPVHSLFVYDPSISSITSALPGYTAAMKQNCPKCTVSGLKVNSAQIGPTLAQQVVSYLQANTDVKYVAVGLGDLATGVPEAIRAAGLENRVKLIVRAATPANLQNVKSGGITVALTSEIYEAGWQAVDEIIRSMVKQPVTPLPAEKVYLLTQSTLPANIGVPFTIPHYQAQFKAAWGVS